MIAETALILYLIGAVVVFIGAMVASGIEAATNDFNVSVGEYFLVGFGLALIWPLIVVGLVLLFPYFIAVEVTRKRLAPKSMTFESEGLANGGDLR